MAGSHHSNSPSAGRLLLALIAAISLFAAACGSGDSTQTVADAVDSIDQTVEDASGDPEAVSPADDAAAEDGTDAEAVESTTEDESAVVADDAGSTDDTVATDDSVATDDDSTDSAAVVSNSPLVRVLSFAAENSTSQSYSFTQGMALQMNLAGIDFNIEPEGAYVFGEVSNGASHLELEMAVILGATFEAAGVDVSEPPFDELLSAFDTANMEMWTDESTLVMDLSGFVNAMEGLDPDQANELAVFANGPVKVDLTQLDGVDAAQLANQLGQGAQVTDPADILMTLREVDAVTEAGTSTVNGVDVTVFNATLSMPEYFDALGQDFSEQLSAANLGSMGSGSDAAIEAAALEALTDVEVEMTVMVDGDDLVRRMDVGIDMGAMLKAMFSNPDVVAALAEEEGQTAAEFEAEMAEVLGDGLEMRIDTWQEFDNYGDTFDIVFPEAVDVTDQIDDLQLAS